MSFTKKPLCAAVAYAMAAGMTLVAADAGAQQSRERIEVTGTNIKRTDSETPSVVQVITREQIERSGSTSVAELLRDLPPWRAGRLWTSMRVADSRVEMLLRRCAASDLSRPSCC